MEDDPDWSDHQARAEPPDFGPASRLRSPYDTLNGSASLSTETLNSYRRPNGKGRLPSSCDFGARKRSSAARIFTPQQDNLDADGARRFEDFATIDWVQDTLFERNRRIREAQTGASDDVRSWISASLEAGQSWFVISIVGALIGVNAALISIVTVWLSDVRTGHCTSGWWLSREFCCWEIDDGDGDCQDWIRWSSWSPLRYLAYVFFSVVFAASCAFTVKSFAPYAAGSGISEIKCILAGFIIRGFLGMWTLAIKSITLPLAIASGLSVGKEGPSVHMAACIGHVVARCFTRFSRSQAKMREIVTAASATGVAVAFGSPIGGVLFALEEMTINFPLKTMVRTFFCALVATVTLSAINPFRTGKLVLFQVSYDRDWHFFEVIFFAIIGIFGGLYGAFVIKYNLQVQSFRRKHLANYAITEVILLALITAMIGYFNTYMRIDMTESLEVLFRECSNGGDYDALCQTWAQWRNVNSLLLATVLRTILVIISYGCKVPAGIFVPSMAVGATFGRMVGILVKALYLAFPHSSFFSACEPEKPCITPGTYALLGAAAALGGIMRITVTVVVIMFELTGALTYILPTMITLMVTKAVGDCFGKNGIADQMITFNGYPFLDKEEHTFNTSVSHLMKHDLVSICAEGTKLDEVEARLRASSFQGFPIVRSRTDATLLGYIARIDLEYAVREAHASAILSPDAICVFVRETYHSPSQSEDEEDYLDLRSWVNETPLCVNPRQPMETVMDLFKKLGPRIILVEQYGKLVGLITIKDILRHILDEDKRAHNREDEPTFEDTLEEAGDWLRKRLSRLLLRLTGRTLIPYHRNDSLPDTLFDRGQRESTESDGIPLDERT
ncbi:uncharacterized protein L969DRAFT_92021 [Mixia osmundae IAM 14324]|uniref:Chloride channel protein n=1 Tax=Mixia osmundae (strain CBS 9802 / IAM 14324 / JCM 22182 / KY 12970) TaxID=764103 RepID=G7DZE0_MIXOS|nr:uncharacterized protein L969DRAFT_92021 [Mixia osmundae IAM 14324]KEI42585.1 hypothetical protein L969DRAFT_92021 [Mixia osmundae IAM 14324]GAA95950.1 hypothetical protein E5Q_02608 [Mixia osmundae IAM 14324]